MQTDVVPGATLDSAHGGTVLGAGLHGISERDGLLAVAYDHASARADSTAFAWRLLWLGLIAWAVASLLVITLIAWVLRPHLAGLRRMRSALAGEVDSSGDADLDATLAAIRRDGGQP
jgi:hypothetical protein